jgi:hypothetical protein
MICYLILVYISYNFQFKSNKNSIRETTMKNKTSYTRVNMDTNQMDNTIQDGQAGFSIGPICSQGRIDLITRWDFSYETFNI